MIKQQVSKPNSKLDQSKQPISTRLVQQQIATHEPTIFPSGFRWGVIRWLWLCSLACLVGGGVLWVMAL